MTVITVQMRKQALKGNQVLHPGSYHLGSWLEDQEFPPSIERFLSTVVSR